MESALYVVGILLVPAILVGTYFRKTWRANTRDDRTYELTPDGIANEPQAIEKTALAKLGLGKLDSNAATVASAGSNRTAPMSVDDHILRPTAGVRGISLFLSAALGFLLAYGDAGIFPAGGDLMKYLIAASVAYAVIFVQTYELRYNRDRLIAPSRTFTRRDKAWRDLVRIQDNDHYLYVLTFKDGSKLEVPKHLVGIADFLTVAQAHIALQGANGHDAQMAARKRRGIFGSRKTVS